VSAVEPFARYFDAPVDYSKEFRDRVAELGRALGDDLRAPVRHEDDMNCSAGQALVVYLTPDGTPTGDELAAAYRPKIWISSRGPLWAALGARTGDGPREWRSCPVAELPAAPVLGIVEERLRAAGLTRVRPASSTTRCRATQPHWTAYRPPSATFSSASSADRRQTARRGVLHICGGIRGPAGDERGWESDLFAWLV
jgi:hypothetical protein